MTLLPIVMSCGVVSTASLPAPAPPRSSGRVEDPHVWVDPSFDDCAPASAVVAARVLGVELPVDDIDALMAMRQAMEVPKTGAVQFESAAVGLRSAGLSVATFSPASVADLGRILDCGCVALTRYPISETVGHAVAIPTRGVTWFRMDDVEEREWRVVAPTELQRKLLTHGNITYAVCRAEGASCPNWVHVTR